MATGGMSSHFQQRCSLVAVLHTSDAFGVRPRWHGGQVEALFSMWAILGLCVALVMGWSLLQSKSWTAKGKVRGVSDAECLDYWRLARTWPCAGQAPRLARRERGHLQPFRGEAPSGDEGSRGR